MAGKAKAKAKTSYKNHHAGSIKGRVHELFDKKGKDAAMALGRRLKMKAATLRTWFYTWKRKPAKKKATKKAAKKK